MNNKLNKIARDTNLFLKNFLKKQGSSKLIPAMKYGLFPGGKKDRYKMIAVEKIPNIGIGKTINDRLNRASKY